MAQEQPSDRPRRPPPRALGWASRWRVEVVFALLPTSHRFPAGSRIRLTVTFADADNFETPVLDPAPAVRLLRDSRHGSFIELPVVR